MTTVMLLIALQAAGTPAEQAVKEAAAHYAKNENEQALAAYDRALSVDAALVPAHLGRCRTLARLTRHEDAVAACGEAIRLDPQNWEAIRDRGHFLINLNRLDAALADMEKAAAMKQGDYQTDYHLGLAYFLRDDFVKAVLVWQACVNDAPEVGNKVACYAWLYPSLRRAGRDAEAAAALEAALALGAKPDAAYMNRLMLFKGTLSEEEAAKQMEANALQQATTGFSIGLWHELNGRADKAREYYTKATASDARTAFGHVAATNALSRTRREPQFENEHVRVWKSIIMPKQPLALHRHERGRAVIALRGGQLKVVDKDGTAIHTYDWETGKAYWLDADPPGQLHGDLNDTSEPIEVIVVELRK